MGLDRLATVLADRARVASIIASSAIEGIIVEDAGRVQRITNWHAGKLRNRGGEKARCGSTEPGAQRPGRARMPHAPNKCTVPVN
jgi:hypothetical protein